MLYDYVDDAMAIFVALKSPEVDVIGLTTIYGNVYTTLATRNALHLASFILYTFGSYNEKVHAKMIVSMVFSWIYYY